MQDTRPKLDSIRERVEKLVLVDDIVLGTSPKKEQYLVDNVSRFTRISICQIYRVQYLWISSLAISDSGMTHI